MRSISESYRECVRNYACQEGRNFAPVQVNKPNIDTQGWAEFYLKYLMKKLYGGRKAENESEGVS